MDKLKALYESYIEEGLLSSETTFEQFSSASSDIQDGLYNQGVENKIISSLFFYKNFGYKLYIKYFICLIIF